MPESNIPRKRSLRPHCKTGKTLTCQNCGADFYVPKCRLRRTGTKSPKFCGDPCKHAGRAVKHGHARRNAGKKRLSATYAAWLGMKTRVKSDGRHSRWYKSKNITIDPEWQESFDAFLRDMGECPEGLTLDRKNGKKGYYKGNCRWIPQKEQNRNSPANRLLTLNGRTQCVGAWAEETGMGEATIRGRLKRGWDVETTLHSPLSSPRLWECKGERKTIREWSVQSGKSVGIIKQRLKRGWSLEDALHQPIHTKFASFHHHRKAA